MPLSDNSEEADPLARLRELWPEFKGNMQTMFTRFQKVCRELTDLAGEFQISGAMLPAAIAALISVKIEDETPPGPLRDLAMAAVTLLRSEQEHDQKIGLAILNWISDGAVRPLETYLDLRYRGTGGNARRNLNLHRRNQMLRQMRREIWPDYTPSETAQATRDIRALMELGGWKSVKMVERYTHLNPDHLAAAINRLPWEQTGSPESEAENA